MRITLLILFLLVFIQVNAQIVEGTVTDASLEHHPLYPVTVVNLTTQKSVYTKDDGSFSIAARPGDKLIFTLVGYSTAEQYISADIFPKKINIQLITYSYQLDEFVLRPKYTPYQLDSLHRSSVYSRAMAWKRTSTIMSPVSFIADRVSGKSKKRLSFQRNFRSWEKEKFVDTRYTPEVVAQLTGLSGDSIGYFMNAYPMPYDYARVASDLEVKMWIRFNYKEWIKNPVIPSTDSAIVNMHYAR